MYSDHFDDGMKLYEILDRSIIAQASIKVSSLERSLPKYHTQTQTPSCSVHRGSSESGCLSSLSSEIH